MYIVPVRKTVKSVENRKVRHYAIPIKPHPRFIYAIAADR